MKFNGSKFKKLLKNRGYTQEEFAEKIGKSKATVSQYINGHYQPVPEALAAIVKALECDISDLQGQSPIDDIYEQLITLGPIEFGRLCQRVWDFYLAQDLYKRARTYENYAKKLEAPDENYNSAS